MTIGMDDEAALELRGAGKLNLRVGQVQNSVMHAINIIIIKGWIGDSDASGQVRVRRCKT